jgi:hypothetical protein
MIDNAGAPSLEVDIPRSGPRTFEQPHEAQERVPNPPAPGAAPATEQITEDVELRAANRSGALPLPPGAKRRPKS